MVTCNSTLKIPCANPRKLAEGYKKGSTIHLSLSTNHRGVATQVYLVWIHPTHGLVLLECSHPDNGDACVSNQLSSSLQAVKTSSVTWSNEGKNYVYIAAESQQGHLFVADCVLPKPSGIRSKCEVSGSPVNNQAKSPSIVLKNGSIWVASIDETQGNKPVLTKCNRRTAQTERASDRVKRTAQTIDFSSCTSFEVIDKVENSESQRALKMIEMFSPHLYIRNNNEILLLVQSGQSNPHTNLFRCTFNTNDEPVNCRWFDLSKGYLPRLTIQENRQFLYWISRQISSKYLSQIFRMDLEF